MEDMILRISDKKANIYFYFVYPANLEAIFWCGGGRKGKIIQN